MDERAILKRWFKIAPLFEKFRETALTFATREHEVYRDKPRDYSLGSPADPDGPN